MKLSSKVLLACICIFKSFFLYPEEPDNLLSEFNQQSLVVSLGASCAQAHNLKFLGLRSRAFPFDWLLSIDAPKFLELIENNFDQFFDINYFTKHEDVLVHSYYHLEFRHELEGLEKLLEKFQRRITRFRQLDSYPGKVFFIRTFYSDATNPTLYWPNEEALNVGAEWSLKLNEALKKLFPHLDFTLIIINNGTAYEQKVIDGVVFLTFPAYSGPEDYRPLFETLVHFPKNPLLWEQSGDQ